MRGRGRGAHDGSRRRREVASRQRRADRRAALRRRRLEPRRRADGARVVAADQDLLDWLRRAGLRRARRGAGAWRSTSRPIITSSSSGRMRSACVDSLVEHFDEPFGDSSAIPTWYVFADGETARHRRALGRWRRRALRRLRPLSAASARRRVRLDRSEVSAEAAAGMPVAASAARRTRQELSASRGAGIRAAATSTRSDCSSPTRCARSCPHDLGEAIDGGTADAGSRSIRDGLGRCRGPAR